jgi:hypothetical protein
MTLRVKPDPLLRTFLGGRDPFSLPSGEAD